MKWIRSMRLLVAILLLTGVVTAAQTIQRPAPLATGATFTFTGAPETFIVPAGVRLLLVEVWGGGGGGGASTPGFDGQGGGGGGYGRALISVAAGDALTIAVAGGGVAGPVGTGGFGHEGAAGQDGYGGAGGGGGSTAVYGGGLFIEGCGGSGGGYNVGGTGQGGFSGGGTGGGGSASCRSLSSGGGASGSSGFAAGEGSTFRGSSAVFAIPGLGANGGYVRSLVSGGAGQTNQGVPPKDGNPGLVRLTYY